MNLPAHSTFSQSSWIKAKRDELATEFLPRATRSRQRHQVVISETEIGGLACQIVEPAHKAAIGTMVYFFGGGYVSGSPDYDQPITAALSNIGRLRVIAPRYPLAPEDPFPNALCRTLEVYKSVLHDLGGPPVGVVGESAGGGLAISLLQSIRAEGIAAPKRLALLSPWCDMTNTALEACQTIKDPSLTTSDLCRYRTAYAGHDPLDHLAASPGLAKIPSKWPPTLLTTGGQDMLRLQTLRFAAALRTAGVTIETHVEPQGCHVFEAYDENPSAHASLTRIASWLRGQE